MLYRRVAAGRPATILIVSLATWRLVVAAAAATFTGGGAVATGQATVVAKSDLAHGVVAAIVKAQLVIAAAVLMAAPCTAAVFPKNPHVEGRVAVKLEVQGAPMA